MIVLNPTNIPPSKECAHFPESLPTSVGKYPTKHQMETSSYLDQHYHAEESESPSLLKIVHKNKEFDFGFTQSQPTDIKNKYVNLKEIK